MYRGPDGYYMPKGGKCIQLDCRGASTGPTTWTCICTKSGICRLKAGGSELEEIGLNAFDQFNSVTECVETRTTFKGEKAWRWADGRRSKAQPAEEVSGGSEWELLEICYDRNTHDFHELKARVPTVDL